MEWRGGGLYKSRRKMLTSRHQQQTTDRDERLVSPTSKEIVGSDRKEPGFYNTDRRSLLLLKLLKDMCVCMCCFFLL